MAGQKSTLTPLGKEIKKKLVDLDMTQQQLADQLGIRKQYITKILKGDRSGKKYLKKIMELLGIEKGRAA